MESVVSVVIPIATADCVAGRIGRSESTAEDGAASAGKFGEDVHLIIDTVRMVMRQCGYGGWFLIQEHALH